MQRARVGDWCLITRHPLGDATFSTQVLMGSTESMLGVKLEIFLAKGFSAVALDSHLEMPPWRGESPAVSFLVKGEGIGARWMQSKSVSDGQGGLIVTTRPVPLGEESEYIVGISRLCLGASLLGPMAHELNNIVQGLSSAEYLIRDCLESGEAIEMEDVDQLAEILRNIKGLASEVQGFSRTPRSESEELQVPRLLLRSVSLLKSVGKLKTMEVNLEIADDLPDVFWPKTELEMVIHSLLVNAAESAANHPDSQRVTVKAFKGEGGVHLIVENSGQHFDLDKSMLPFVTSKVRHRHVGLGLTVVKQLLSAAGGSIQQRQMESGSSIEVTLPVE